MSDDYPEIHYTEINRIQDGDEGGWEFVCRSCGYRARYTIDKYGTQNLVILYMGDSSARHTSGEPEQTPLSGVSYPGDQVPLDDAGLVADDRVDDTWLPAELREQVEAIMRKFD